MNSSYILSVLVLRTCFQGRSRTGYLAKPEFFIVCFDMENSARFQLAGCGVDHFDLVGGGARCQALGVLGSNKESGCTFYELSQQFRP